MSKANSNPFAVTASATALRVTAAFIFLCSGTTKLFAWPGSMPQGIVIERYSQMWVGGVLEIVGGALLLLGLFTRPVAFLMSGMMAVAYFQFHAPNGGWLWPTVNGGGEAVLLCFLWLYFAAAGAGPWSLDAKLRR